MGVKSFLIDVEKCSSCGLCIVACKDEHVENSHLPWAAPQPATDHFWIDLIKLERGKTPRVRMSYLPLNCQHCADAPCMTKCSDGAIKRRDDGLVWIDPELCSGCGDCKEACPYDVIFMNEELEIAQKCTGCAHRVDAGEQPRCAEVCPHDAILFGDAESLARGAGSDGRPTEIFHPEYETRPTVMWKGLPRPWIAGMVVDADSDEVVVGASVVVTDQSNRQTSVGASDEFGDFWIKGLSQGGRYMVSITKDGYDEFSSDVVTAEEYDLGTVFLKAQT
jgi:Fe-S-cluster-containing dehydrogenase component